MRLNIVTILHNLVNHSPTPNYRHFISLQMLHVTKFYIFIRTWTRTHARIILSRITKSSTWICGSYSQKTLFRAGLANLNPQEGHKIR